MALVFYIKRFCFDRQLSFAPSGEIPRRRTANRTLKNPS
jgi:hypothetical protein